MAEPFKNLINAEVVRLMRRHLQRAWAGFDGARFEALGGHGLESLELKARARHLCVALEATLPADFEAAAAVIEASLAPAPGDEVLRTIGRPSNVGYVGWHKTQTVWSYRYASPFCQWFQVGLSEAGVVEDTGYGPDPICDDVDKPLHGIFRR